MSQLKNNIEEIKRQQDLFLIPRNIKENISIFNIYGSVKASENITSDDILWYSNITSMNSKSGLLDQMAVVYDDINDDYQRNICK